MSDRQSHYVIVGGSAAGMAAAQVIREKDRQGTITVLSDEPDAPYFRPLIPFLVSGRKRAEEMVISGNGPYTANGIEVRTGARVASCDATGQRLVLADGTRQRYQKVLFATGSRPFIPPGIAGTEAEGVFALRTLDDARRMAARVAHCDHAVLLGGGLLNLKAAFALLERGVAVTLVVYSPEILSQLMEPEDAYLIRKALDAAGLTIVTGTAAVGITADATGVTGVVLDDDRELACQMVCIGKGVRPNVEFLADSGVEVAGGIVADRYTATNLPGAFTAGDVAVTYEPVSGAPVMTALWTNAVEMGRCAGLNMAGVKTAYTGTFGILNATQVAGVPFVAMGVVHKGAENYEVHRCAGTTCLRKMVFTPEGDRLVGAVLVGDIARAGLYRYIIREKRDVTRFKRAIIDHTLHYGHFLK